MTNHYAYRRNRTSRSSYRGPRKSRRPASETEKGNSLLPLAAAGAGIFLLAAVSAVTISHFKGKPAVGSHETSLSETDASLTAPAVTVNGISLNGLSPDESFEALNQLFPWDMKAEYGEEQLAVENPLSPRLKEWNTLPFLPVRRSDPYPCRHDKRRIKKGNFNPGRNLCKKVENCT